MLFEIVHGGKEVMVHIPGASHLGYQKRVHWQMDDELAFPQNFVFKEAEMKSLANLKVEIEPEGLKQLVEEGRLVEFVDTFSLLAAGAIRAQIVDQVAKAGVGKGIEITIGFHREDGEFGTGGPWKPPKGWPGPVFGEAMAQALRRTMTR
jgi:hypothetical protein